MGTPPRPIRPKRPDYLSLGVVAARELSRAGHHVILLEGRDRLGGRTWSKRDALPGRTLEVSRTGSTNSRSPRSRVEVRGDLPRPLVALAPDDHVLQYLHTEELLPDGQLLVGLGGDAAALDVNSLEGVAGPVRQLLGDVEVVATTGHDWLADEFSQGTWPVLRPNQTVRMLRGLQAPEGRVHFAGSETANGWNGFIDGAIESGLRAAREIRHALASTAEPD